jgi:hypothetical protein
MPTAIVCDNAFVDKLGEKCRIDDELAPLCIVIGGWLGSDCLRQRLSGTRTSFDGVAASLFTMTGLFGFLSGRARAHPLVRRAPSPRQK